MPTTLQATSDSNRAFCAMTIRRDVKSPPTRTADGANAPSDDFKAALKSASRPPTDQPQATKEASATATAEPATDAEPIETDATAGAEAEAEAVDAEALLASDVAGDAQQVAPPALPDADDPAAFPASGKLEANGTANLSPAPEALPTTPVANAPLSNAETADAPAPTHGNAAEASAPKPEAQANSPIALPEAGAKEVNPTGPRSAEAGADQELQVQANRPVTIEGAGVSADGEGGDGDPASRPTRPQGQAVANQQAQAVPETALDPAPDAAAGANRAASLPMTESVGANQPAPTVDAPAGQRVMQAMQPLGLSPGRAADPARLPEQNVDAVVAAARVGLSGGKQQYTMMLRLDPPQLGSMRLSVRMVEGQLTATFSTSSDVAHQMLQQSLNQLRAGLENAGFQVDRLQVQRTNPESQGGLSQQQGGGDSREQMQQQHRDHQRRETLTRLWRSGWFEESGLNTTA